MDGNRNPRLLLAATFLLVVILASLASVRGQAGGNGEESAQGFWPRVYKAYRIILELHESGVDTSNLTGQLNEALALWEAGNRSVAESLLEKVIIEGEALKAVEGQARVRVSLYKYGVAACLLGIAPLTYFLLPRLYVEAWYRSRRQWVVEREAPRR